MNLIDTRGNAYQNVAMVSIEKEGSTYGYNLMIQLRGVQEPVCIGYATPGEDLLPKVKDLIARHLVSDAKVLDLREHYQANTTHFGWYGCTIIPR